MHPLHSLHVFRCQPICLHQAWTWHPAHRRWTHPSTIGLQVCGDLTKDERSDSYGTVQLGIGTKNGAGAAGHATRVLLEAESSPGTVFLKIDFSNAFNSIRRDTLLYRDCIPALPQRVQLHAGYVRRHQFSYVRGARPSYWMRGFNKATVTDLGCLVTP